MVLLMITESGLLLLLSSPDLKRVWWSQTASANGLVSACLGDATVIWTKKTYIYCSCCAEKDPCSFDESLTSSWPKTSQVTIKWLNAMVNAYRFCCRCGCTSALDKNLKSGLSRSKQTVPIKIMSSSRFQITEFS